MAHVTTPGSSFSGIKRLRHDVNKVAGAPIAPGATLLNMSGVDLQLPDGVGPTTTLDLPDVWGDKHVSSAQVESLVQFLLGLEGAVHLRAVCNAGRNRSRFAAALYCVFFNLPLGKGCEPETNVDFQGLLQTARERAQVAGATPEAIGKAVIDHSKSFA